MALIDGSKKDLISLTNRTNQVPLLEAGLYFSPLVSGGADSEAVRVRLSTQPYYEYRGTQVVEYTRLSLDDLPGLLHSLPRMAPKSTLHALLPRLRTALGIELSPKDVVDGPVTPTETGYQVTLTARPESYGWVGSCTLGFLDLPPLEIPLKQTHINW